MNIIFTGIVSYTPTSAGPCDCVEEVRFIMPNVRQWRASLNEPQKLIPPHQPFLIARERDVAKVGDSAWKGAPPSGRLFERWVYWILQADHIRVDDLNKDGVVYGNTHDVVRLRDLCPEAEVCDECAKEESPRVGARVALTSGRLSQRSVTTEMYCFETCAGPTIGPKAIADEVQVAIKGHELNVNGEVVLKRLRLNGQKAARDPIILKPKNVGGLMTIYFGSAPEADLGAVVSRIDNHEHGETNIHFELHYDVSKRRPYPPLPVPKRRPATYSGAGPIGGSDRCPPTTG
ncbi:MAG TPA: hypothetical protein VGF48_07750 [Thermoanaerobaculia bacterium]